MMFLYFNFYPFSSQVLLCALFPHLFDNRVGSLSLSSDSVWNKQAIEPRVLNLDNIKVSCLSVSLGTFYQALEPKYSKIKGCSNYISDIHLNFAICSFWFEDMESSTLVIILLMLFCAWADFVSASFLSSSFFLSLLSFPWNSQCVITVWNSGYE